MWKMLKRKKKEISVKTIGGQLPDDSYFDLIKKGGKLGFVNYMKGVIEVPFITNIHKGDNVWYVPYDKGLLYLDTYTPTPTDYEAEEKLWDEVRSYIWEHFDYIDEAIYDILTAWVHATYLMEHWTAVVYLAFLGPSGSGKSRAQEILTVLSYRGLHVTDFKTAGLFRTIEMWRPTLLFDETENMTSEQNQALISMINSGQRRASKAIRCVPGEQQGDFIPMPFNLFGFKSLAGTRSWVTTMRRRSIILHCSENFRDVKEKVDLEWAERLRAKLLMYRIKHIDNRLPNVSRKELGLNNAIFELFEPLLIVAPNKELKEKLGVFARKEQLDRKEDRASTDIAFIFEAIMEIHRNTQDDKVPIMAIRDYLNRDMLDDKEMYNSKVVGKIARTLGFRPTRGTNGVRCVKWDEKIAERLSKQLGIEYDYEDKLDMDTFFDHK